MCWPKQRGLYDGPAKYLHSILANYRKCPEHEVCNFGLAKYLHSQPWQTLENVWKTRSWEYNAPIQTRWTCRRILLKTSPQPNKVASSLQPAVQNGLILNPDGNKTVGSATCAGSWSYGRFILSRLWPKLLWKWGCTSRLVGPFRIAHYQRRGSAGQMAEPRSQELSKFQSSVRKWQRDSHL